MPPNDVRVKQVDEAYLPCFLDVYGETRRLCRDGSAARNGLTMTEPLP